MSEGSGQNAANGFTVLTMSQLFCANLDPAATRRVEALIRSFVEAGKKVFMATHNIAQAQRLADEVLFLNYGRLLEHAPAKQFMTGPSDPVAARFIAGELVE